METGTTLGPYEVVGALGAGGMGEVYRARDTRLDRAVAIKVLPESMARDPERVARFQREAKLLASLNHPNIAAIYGFEEHRLETGATVKHRPEAGATHFLVLEYVEGETLAARLKRGALPVDEALEVARQIAAGVEAAHEKGVIHRDLKPGNVMLTAEGTVKVLDFGLARAVVDETTSSGSAAAGGADSPTVTVQSPAITGHYTRPGVILGTAAYMSPEQARGRAVDKRTDIWSFGVVLYECLTAATLFHGDTVTDSLGAILHKEPDWSRLPPATPPTVQLLLRRCLSKDRHRRLQDIGDARVELEEAIADPTSSSLGLAASAMRQAGARRRSRGVAAVVMLAAVLAVGALGVMAGRRLVSPEPARVRKYEIPLGQEGTWSLGQPAISPDGTMVAFVDRDRIWVRRLDAFDAQEVADSAQGMIPFWSPDSQWLGFAREDKLYKVAVSGGRPTVIARAPRAFSPVGGAGWSRDGRILFSTGDTGILEVAAGGGEPRMVVAPELADDDDFHELALLPDGQSFVFCVHSRGRPWYLAAWDGRERTVVLQLDQQVRAPAYSPTGHILFERLTSEPSVWALPFSAERVEATGKPFLVSGGDGDPTVSDTGALALKRRSAGLEGGELLSVDLASGATETVFKLEGVYYDPALSPEGTTVALAGFDFGAVDLWLVDIQQGTRTRLTFEERTNELLPRWSPDGKEIAVVQTTASVFERMAAGDTIRFVSTDGSGETREPIPGGYPTFDGAWAYIAFVRTGAETGRDIHFMALDGSVASRPLLQSEAFEQDPALSPDGEWLAYTSDESGAEQVYVTRFPSGQGKWQVSTQHGMRPAWSPDGSRLYFATGTASIYEVQITREPRVMLSRPRLVAEGVALGINPFQGFTISADGERLLAIKSGAPAGPSAIGVIENWFAEFDDRR